MRHCCSTAGMVTINARMCIAGIAGAKSSLMTVNAMLAPATQRSLDHFSSGPRRHRRSMCRLISAVAKPKHAATAGGGAATPNVVVVGGGWAGA